ncbi:hypothetical protein DLH98_25160 [Vibrio parahaemolyticus]|nr:hypothetical protein [Vibrio parahaemolyticus]EGR2948553.1 hypothetical protein [Vibrio parahaemolyticus]MCW7948985.1 hypothetical protein [Vibrio parahaemolyticus]
MGYVMSESFYRVKIISRIVMKLDYMVFRDVQGAGGGNVSATVFFAMLISMYNSDHFPVSFY